MFVLFKKSKYIIKKTELNWLILFPFIAITLCFADENGISNSPDKIEFVNGDSLRGVLKNIKNNSLIEFTPAIFGNPITVDSKGIGKIYFGSTSQNRLKARGNSIIRLVNEDTFFGNFISLDQGKLMIDTSFGGKLTIDRNQVKTLIPSSGAGVIYDGPNSLNEWTVHNPGYFVNVIVPGSKPGAVQTIQRPPLPWGFTNDALYSINTGAIGNFFELPDKISLDFELAWRGNLSFSVFLYTDSLAPYSGKSYMILFTYRAAYLHRRASVSGITVLGQVEIPELTRESSVNISIKVDKQERLIALFVNDRLAQVWKDESEFVGGGNGIVFNQQSTSKVKLSKIRITKWDGIVEEQLNSTNKVNADIVKLTNKDMVEGQVLAIKNGIVSVKTEYAPLEIPFERVSEIIFSNPSEKKTDSETKIVRGYLREYGNVSFAIEEWNKEKIIGLAPGIGKIEFSPSAFRIIQFNETKSAKESNTDTFFEDFNDLGE